MTAVQVEYSLLQRTVEGEQFGAARELGLGITTWSPLASDVLTGKDTRSNTSPEGSGRAWHAARRMNEETFAVLDVLEAGRQRGPGIFDGGGRPGLGPAAA